MTEKHIKLGLFGFGCVGQGLYDVLNHSENFKADIEKICVKDKTKKRKIAADYFTYDKEDILNREDLNAVVELIDNSADAYQIVSRALGNGVNVVTANKKMLAENFQALYNLLETQNVALIYEGAAAGSIPIIRNLEEYYDNELLSSIKGILNGSCNYILSRMELENMYYGQALKLAQESGFAESDPWLDVAGFDTMYKLILLSVHAFGIVLTPEQVLVLGIQNISFDDIKYAKEKGLRIKLIATAHKVGEKFRVYAMPHFVGKESELYNVLYENNGVEVEGAYSCKQTFVGKGAGSHPTGSAVLSDISALTYNYKYGYKKLKKLQAANSKAGQSFDSSQLLDNDFTIRVYIRFADKADLKTIDILEIEEEYKSQHTNYVIAKVKFKSLFSLKGNRDSKVFVCAV